METDPRQSAIRDTMSSAIDWYLTELERFGPLKTTPPALMVNLADGLTGLLPLESLEAEGGTATDLHATICRYVLDELKARFYIFVCDVRTDSKPIRYGALCTGGYPGWDTSIAFSYRFKNKRVEVVNKTKNQASTEARPFHLTAVPNFFDMALPPLETDQADALKSVAKMLAGVVLENVPADRRSQLGASL